VAGSRPIPLFIARRFAPTDGQRRIIGQPAPTLSSVQSAHPHARGCFFKLQPWFPQHSSSRNHHLVRSDLIASRRPLRYLIPSAMSRSPPPGTVVPDALDGDPGTIVPDVLNGDKVDELYDKYKIALLEFKGCDELLKTKKISAEKRKVSFPLPSFRCLVPNNMISLQADKQRYRNKMNHAKRAISNMGLDRECFNIHA
jgi:hypothetical protein